MRQAVFLIPLLALAGIAPAQEPSKAAPAAAPAKPAVDVAALAKELDALYDHRDEGDHPGQNDKKVSEALKAAPDDYEILWRALRWYFWAADGSADEDQKERLGKLGWDLGDKATAKNPSRAEGWYYAAIALGCHAQSMGILTALTKGMEGKFLERIKKAEALDPTIDRAGPSVSMGRYFFELPWPKYDGNKSIEWLRKALEREPKNARAHLYLAETFLKEGKAKKALEHLNECLAIAPGTKDAPEERRVHVLATALKPKIEKEAK